MTGTSLAAAPLYPLYASTSTRGSYLPFLCLTQKLLPPAFAFTVLVTVFASDAEAEATALHAIGAAAYSALLLQVPCSLGLRQYRALNPNDAIDVISGTGATIFAKPCLYSCAPASAATHKILHSAVKHSNHPFAVGPTRASMIPSNEGRSWSLDTVMLCTRVMRQQLVMRVIHLSEAFTCCRRHQRAACRTPPWQQPSLSAPQPQP